MHGSSYRPPRISSMEDRAKRPDPQGWAVVQTPESTAALGHGTPGYPAAGPSITPIFSSAAGNAGPRPFCAEAFLSLSPVESQHNSSAGSFQRRDSVSSGFSQGESTGSPSVSGSLEQASRPSRSQKPLSSLRTSVSVPNFFHAKPTSLLRKKCRESDACVSVAREGAFWGDFLDDDDKDTSSPTPGSGSVRPLHASPSLSGLSGTPSPLPSHRSAEGCAAPSGSDSKPERKGSSGSFSRRSFFQKPLRRTLSKFGTRGESCPDFYAQNRGTLTLSPAASFAGEGESLSSSSSVGTDLSQLAGEEPSTASVPVLSGVSSAASVPVIFGGASIHQVRSSPSLQGIPPVAPSTTCPPPSLSRIQASELEQTIGTEFLSSLSARRLRLASEAAPPTRPTFPGWTQQPQSRQTGTRGSISRRLSIRQLVQRSSSVHAPQATAAFAKGGEGPNALQAVGDRPQGSGRFGACDSDPGFDADALRVGEVSAVPEEVNGHEESGSSHGSSPESEGLSDGDGTGV
ncbi:UNVERIFIED_CONTAM: hypothetical protein HHA_265460 [Hammondia hammondi]|eukprot:XP_008887180.1 hypothetical protein HHA_265460 [Hammondia hammondi]